MSQQILYKICPLCQQQPVTQQGAHYRCGQCGLTLKQQSKFLFLKGDKYEIITLGLGNFKLAQAGLQGIALSADELKVVLGNVYNDEQLSQVAKGDFKALRPVSMLAQIILEQLREDCFLQVRGIKRGHRPVLQGESSYQPTQPVPTSMEWKDKGNLFCTTNRLVMPSDHFTFIRLGRNVLIVQAFTNGIGVQQKKEEFATYFVGCYSHEAAAVAAYSMGKLAS